MSETATMAWPETCDGGALGDGFYAHSTLRPDSVEVLRDTIREHVGRGHAIYPQGGGTAIDYGGIPGRPGVAIDTRALGAVIDYPHADMTVTVQAGITLAALRAVLAEQNQRLLIDAPRPAQATLGGIYATSTCGPRRYGLGRPRDQVIGISFVTSDGVEVKGGGRVVKNVAGYDLPKLLTGSMGSLGIITQLTLKVRPLPEASAIIWTPFKVEDDLARRLESLNFSDSRPVAIELLNAPAARAIAKGMDLPISDWVFALGLEDNSASVRWQVDRLAAELGQETTMVREGPAAAPLWEGLTELQHAGSGPFGLVASIRPSSVMNFVENLVPDDWAIQAHAGNGIVRLHALGEWSLDRAHATVCTLRNKAAVDGGSVIVSRCPTEWKERIQVWGDPRPDWDLSRRIKEALDPAGAMNPGRFVGGI